MLALHDLQGFLSVFGGNGLIAGAFQHGLKQQTGVLVIVCDEDPDHGLFTSLFRNGSLAGGPFLPVVDQRSSGADHAPHQQDCQHGGEQGVFFQVNGSSLLGKWGLRGKRFAWKALSTGAVVSVASDAHGWEHRPPCLGKVYALVEKKLGTEVAKALFYDLPMAILEGQRLSY